MKLLVDVGEGFFVGMVGRAREEDDVDVPGDPQLFSSLKSLFLGGGAVGFDVHSGRADPGGATGAAKALLELPGFSLMVDEAVIGLPPGSAFDFLGLEKGFASPPKEEGGFVKIGFEIVMDQEDRATNMALREGKGPGALHDGGVRLLQEVADGGRSLALQQPGKLNRRKSACSTEFAVQQVPEGEDAVFPEPASDVLLEGVEMEGFKGAEPRGDEGNLMAQGEQATSRLEDGDVGGGAGGEDAEWGQDDELHFRWGGLEGGRFGGRKRSTVKIAGRPSLP